MRARLVSAHFWSADEATVIKHTDLAAFRYEGKKPSTHSIYREGKKIYVEKRGQTWSLPTKRPLKLKDCLQELTELLKEHKLIYCTWKSDNWLCLIFSTGLIAYLGVNNTTADITKILFDRYLVGKLLSANVSEVLFTDTHIFLTYNDNQAILVNFNKPSIKSTSPEKLSKRDPKFQTVELVGGWRRGGRQVSGSVSGASALVWSRASPSDLFPWSPRAPHEDHANVHVYSLQGSHLSLQCFHRIEFDPICVSFSKIHEKIIYSVEQKTSRKGGVIVECRQLEIKSNNDLEERETIRVAAPAPATCASRSPCETFLLLTCSDRSVLLHHYVHNVTTSVTAAFVARTCCWWQDGGAAAIAVGGVGSQMQCWDTALAPISLAPVADHLPPSAVLDLSPYFRKEPTMTHLLWNHNRTTRMIGGNGFLSGDGLMLAVMQDGPLVCIRIHAPTFFQGDEAGGGPVFLGSEATAVARLRTLDWISQGTTCLALLHRIINSLFSRPLNIEREELAQAALGTFLAPPQPLPSTVRLAHLPQLRDLCRRFFHHLMRFGRLEKAFSLAIDVGHHDLFMDIKYAAEAIGASDLANEAVLRAEEVLSSCESSCSRMSCSHCSSSSDLSLENESTLDKPSSQAPKQLDIYGQSSSQNQSIQPLLHRTPPPLPYLHNTHSSYHKNILPPSGFPLPKLPVQSKFTERENFPWNENISHPLDGMAPVPLPGNRILHRVVEIIPQPVTKSQSALDLFQTELPENAANLERPQHVDRSRFNLNPLKTESLLNLYTPVYHQHPTLSGRIPSTISTLQKTPSAYFPMSNNRDQVTQVSGQNNKDITSLSMQSIREELPMKSSMYRPEFAGSSPLAWNTRMHMSNSNRNFGLPPSKEFLSTSMSQINKMELLTNKQMDKSTSVLSSSKITPVPVIKTSTDGENITTKPPGEKNKVKFSDTVQVAVVPEIPRKERRPVNPGRGLLSSTGGLLGHLDPQRELADSLPLCHPNHDYLKDFTPQSENEEKEKPAKIKVVHFGVV